jgi:gas vesicle protein
MTENENGTTTNSTNTTMVGALMLVAGGLVGAGLALLFAPQSGRETRKDIRRLGKKVKQGAQGVAEEVAEQLAAMADAVSDKTSELAHQGKTVARGTKKELLRAIDEVTARLEKERARLVKLFD